MARPGKPASAVTEAALGRGKDTHGDKKAEAEADRLEAMLGVNMADFFEPGTHDMKPLHTLPKHVQDCVKKIAFDAKGRPKIELYDRTTLLRAWTELTGRKANKERTVHTVLFDTRRASDASAEGLDG